jgi:carbon-monoxide dehydrogenase medium subunit
MVALNGSIVAKGPKGIRQIPINEFVSGPFQTVLAPDEIAVQAVIPAADGTRAGGYLKLERRVGDFATAGVAIALEMKGGTVGRAGIGLTGVGAATINASAAADALVGSSLDATTIKTAAQLAADAAQPRSDHRGSASYKKHVVATFVKRILANLAHEEQKVA